MPSKRPELPGLVQPGTTEIESFQNNVLRPIIKMQHDLLIASFKKLSEKRKIDFPQLNTQAIETHIKNSCMRDASYKNFILGMIIGHFTEKEYNQYALSSSEYNKRIIQMIKGRLLDSIPEFR
ncbi:MAG: glyoxalase [Flavobacteriaceae bacterium]